MKPEGRLMRAIFGEPDNFYYEEVNGVKLHDALIEALDSIAHGERWARVHPGFAARYKQIILLRFGFEPPDGSGKTLEQVAREFDVSRERIRQIETKTLRLLRHPRRSRRLKKFLK